jgi:hypothetical protein
MRRYSSLNAGDCGPVREYLFSRRVRSLRRDLVPYAEAQGIFTDEDVFRELS